MLVWLKNHLQLFCLASIKKATGLQAFARKLYEQILEDGVKEKRKKKGEPTHFTPFNILSVA
jgi:hypothetical protein